MQRVQIGTCTDPLIDHAMPLADKPEQRTKVWTGDDWAGWVEHQVCTGTLIWAVAADAKRGLEVLSGARTAMGPLPLNAIGKRHGMNDFCIYL